MDADIQRVLREVFQFTSLRGEVQRGSVLSLLKGRDVFVLAPTGMGKSLIYSLPAVLRFQESRAMAVVVSPLLALMENQITQLEKKKVPCAALSSSQTPKSNAELMARLSREDQGSLALLFVTPERVASEGFRSWLRGLYHKKRLSLFAIDEAHCISTFGHDFRPKYRQLSWLKESFSDIPLVALTATATRRVQEDIIGSLRLERNRVDCYCQSFNRPNIFYTVIYKDVIPHGPEVDIVQYIREREGQCGIVYAVRRLRSTSSCWSEISKTRIRPSRRGTPLNP